MSSRLTPRKRSRGAAICRTNTKLETKFKSSISHATQGEILGTQLPDTTPLDEAGSPGLPQFPDHTEGAPGPSHLEIREGLLSNSLATRVVSRAGGPPVFLSCCSPIVRVPHPSRAVWAGGPVMLPTKWNEHQEAVPRSSRLYRDERDVCF